MARQAPAKKSAPAKESAAAPQEEPTREAPAMEEATASMYDNLIDCARAVDKKFADQDSKEPDQEFFGRILKAISEDEKDEFYETLSDDEKEWYNTQVRSLRTDRDYVIQAPEGFVSKFGVKSTSAPPKKSAAKAPAKQAAPKEPRAPGVVAITRRIIVENASKSSADIKAILADKKMDVRDSTFAAIFTDTQATIKLAKELNLWAA